MLKNTQIRAYVNGYYHEDTIALCIYAIDPSATDLRYKSLHVATNITMETREEGSEVMPLMRIDRTQAQQLMDDLWACGVRPVEGKGSAGQLAATERHLADMQKLTFTMLEELTDGRKMDPRLSGMRNEKPD